MSSANFKFHSIVSSAVERCPVAGVVTGVTWEKVTVIWEKKAWEVCFGMEALCTRGSAAGSAGRRAGSVRVYACG